MPTRNATAVWNGTLKDGGGQMRLGSGVYEASYSFPSRFEDGTGTNPEELVAAAHAGCFSMALSHALSEAGHPADSVETEAKVHLEKSDDGFSIPKIELATVGKVPGIDENTFQEYAEKAKANCPVSKLLSGATISLTANLAS